MTNTTIIIVDDHLLFSKALNNLINKFSRFHVLCQLKNGKELVDYVKGTKKNPQIVLMDINMPIMNGIDATQWLKDNHPEIRVLALSMDDNEHTILKMLRAGARGYLLKDIQPSVLEDALNQVNTKGIYYTERVANTLLHSHDEKEDNLKKVLLKERELEFLKLACTELTYREIAEKMFLSPKTIDGYREVLFEKFSVKNRVGLVLYAIKEKIVDL